MVVRVVAGPGVTRCSVFVVVECTWAGQVEGSGGWGVPGGRGCPSTVLPGLSRGRATREKLALVLPMHASYKMPIKTFDLNSDKSLFPVSS